MPNKLTDKEIVKALECCASGEFEECKNCPYVEGYPYCDGPMERDVLDLINRLQAENERLKTPKQVAMVRSARGLGKSSIILREYTDAVKTEAYKEFAERLKIRFSGTISCNYGAIKQAVDKLIKELVGEDK